MSEIAGLWGDEKTGKSSLALTWPKPIAHFDMDFGVGRVMHRFQEDFDKGLIVTKPYALKLEDVMFTSSKGRPIKGAREVYEQFITDYVAAVMDEDVATLVIDTSTQLWEIVRLGYLQEKQELQKESEKLRERLLPVEYGEPNGRMRNIIQAARSYDKHLVLVHYAKDEYKPQPDSKGGISEQRTGKIILDGFKWTPDLSDIIIQTRREDSTFFGKVTLCGLAVSLEGTELQDPTYELFMGALDKLR